MLDIEMEQEQPPRRDPTLTILFSLFLTVFAFFILLNAISTHHRGREQTVARSVSATFAEPPAGVSVPPIAGAAAPADTGRDPAAGEGSAASAPGSPASEEAADDEEAPTPVGAGTGTSDAGAGTALRAARLAGTGPLDGAGLTRAVGRLFDPGLPVTRTITSDRGRLMQITLAATELFDADGPDVKRSAVPLIDRIAVLIARRPTGVRYAVAFTAAVANEADAAERALAIRRGIAMTEVWSRRGGPPDGLSIGLRPGRKGEVRLTFEAAGSDGEPVSPRSGNGRPR